MTGKISELKKYIDRNFQGGVVGAELIKKIDHIFDYIKINKNEI